MEPMALGSPTSSPLIRHTNAAPTFPGTPTFSSQTSYSAGSASSPAHGFLTPGQGNAYHQSNNPGGFLPGYLMGDYSNQGSTSSPSKLNRSLSVNPAPTGASTPVTPGQGLLTAKEGFLTPNASHIRTPSDKPGGPPTSGLFSKNNGTPKFGSTPKYGTPQLLGTPKPPLSTPVPASPHMSFGGTPAHSTSVRERIFNTSSADSRDDAWVTVFGFPPSAASFVLSQFSQYGTILQHQIPSNGNWMHLKYQTKMQAHKALGKSNTIVGGSIMIGVCPCSDKNVEENTLNSSSVVNRSSLDDSSVTNLNSSLGGARLNSSIRPLTQAYKAANVDNEITGSGSTPNRNNSGIVGKAMEYIFGW